MLIVKIRWRPFVQYANAQAVLFSTIWKPWYLDPHCVFSFFVTVIVILTFDFVSASPVVARATAPSKRCDYCSKLNTPGHILAEHSEVAFRCKTCPMDDEKNCFVNLLDVRRHCIQAHSVCDFTARLSQLIVIPSNLVCLKCKFCCDHLYAQTLEDIQNHFKTEHPSVKNFGKHLDFLCRRCMQCDTHETWNDLKLHLADEHGNVATRNDGCGDVAKDDAITQQERDADKETSPDVSCSVFAIVRPLIDSLIDSSIPPSN